MQYIRCLNNRHDGYFLFLLISNTTCYAWGHNSTKVWHSEFLDHTLANTTSYCTSLGDLCDNVCIKPALCHWSEVMWPLPRRSWISMPGNQGFSSNYTYKYQLCKSIEWKVTTNDENNHFWLTLSNLLASLHHEWVQALICMQTSTTELLQVNPPLEFLF